MYYDYVKGSVVKDVQEDYVLILQLGKSEIILKEKKLKKKKKQLFEKPSHENRIQEQ